MIELLKDFPDNVAAFAFYGHVTKADYDTVLIPDFEDALVSDAEWVKHVAKLRVLSLSTAGGLPRVPGR